MSTKSTISLRELDGFETHVFFDEVDGRSSVHVDIDRVAKDKPENVFGFSIPTGLFEMMVADCVAMVLKTRLEP